MKEIFKFDNDFNKFLIKDKIKYIEKLLEINELDEVINSLIYNNSDILETFSIMNSIYQKKQLKNNKRNISNSKITSMIINCLINQNQTKKLNKYLDTLDESSLKKIINYEIKNNTAFSKLKICKDLIKKYQKNNSKKTIDKDLDSKKIVNKSTKKSNDKSIKNKSNKNSKINKILKKQIKSKKAKWSIGIIIAIVFFVFSYIIVGYLYAILLFYNNHVYPNIYLDDKLIEGKSHEQLTEELNTINNNLNDFFNLKNLNNEYEYKYSDIGIIVNTNEIKENIINRYDKLNGFQKIIKIFKADELKYKVEYELDEVKYEKFLNDLKGKVNVSKKDEVFSLSNGTIKYEKGVNGFTVNTTDLYDSILNTISSDNKTIELKGNVVMAGSSLSTINSKVASYTTYYKESQGRAKNIRNAVSKLNGKIIYPNETFSFYKTVGPYNSSKGYIFYDKDVGSGVCQVSTTIYNTQLLLNLQTVSRYNHGDMVYYVDYGMDATVYGSSVDYKFKNNTDYPIYIEATARNGALTVSFWSNSNIIKPGYSYKPRVERKGYLSYRTYLDTYYNGNYIGTTYLNSSVYSKGK